MRKRWDKMHKVTVDGLSGFLWGFCSGSEKDSYTAMWNPEVCTPAAPNRQSDWESTGQRNSLSEHIVTVTVLS